MFLRRHIYRRNGIIFTPVARFFYSLCECSPSLSIEQMRAIWNCWTCSCCIWKRERRSRTWTYSANCEQRSIWPRKIISNLLQLVSTCWIRISHRKMNASGIKLTPFRITSVTIVFSLFFYFTVTRWTQCPSEWTQNTMQYYALPFIRWIFFFLWVARYKIGSVEGVFFSIANLLCSDFG